jgi:hypothetical protein
MAMKREFTISDMRKAFVRGAALAEDGNFVTGGWDFEKWIREVYRPRYIQKRLGFANRPIRKAA